MQNAGNVGAGSKPAQYRIQNLKNLCMKKYRCMVCGHVYDEAEGDPMRGFPPGTKFEDLPDDWTCPICGVLKEEYVEIEE